MMRHQLIALFSLYIFLPFILTQTSSTASALTACTIGSFLDPLTLSCKTCPGGYTQYAGIFTSCFCNGVLAAATTTYPKVGGFVCTAQTGSSSSCVASYQLDGSADTNPTNCVLVNTATQATANIWYQRKSYQGFEFYYKYNAFTPTGCTAYVSNVPKLMCQTAQTLDYTLSTTGTSITSQFMIYHFDQAYIWMSTYDYHQKLANLCVLTQYSQDTTKACAMYSALVTAKKASTADSLYFQYPINVDSTYTKLFSTTYQVQPLRINGKQTSDSTRSPYINFKLLTYDLDGNLINMDVANAGQFANLDNQLFLCPSTDTDGQNFKEFGTDFTLKCTVNSAQFQNDRTQSVFYELLIQTSNSNAYLKVPVQIVGQSNFYTRFYIVDNITGFSTTNTQPNQSYLNSDALPTQFTVATSMNMVINIQPNNNQIDLPILYITYTTVTDTTTTPTLSISFKASYTQNSSNFPNVAQPIFITFAAITGVIWLFKYNIWSKYNPQSKNISPEAFFFLWVTNGIHILIDVWADFSFYFLFFATGYWFITYKLQETLYTLIINSDTNSGTFQGLQMLIIIQYAFKTASFLKFVYHQLETDVLFIDWENQKQFNEDDEKEEKERGISIWRTLFVANEFNELSIERVTSFEWTLFWVGFFLTGLSWDNLAQEIPYLDTTSKDYVSLNEGLRFFIAALLYVVIVLIQIIVKKLFIIWNPTPIQDFTDLCTIANISIFILDEQLHGYYLHGKTPSGISEGNTQWLKEAIEKESQSGQHRGLVRGESVQTFEIFIPIQLRYEYKTKYQFEYDRMKANYNQDQWILARTVQKGMIVQMENEKTKEHIINVVKTFIQEVQIHSNNHVLNKSFINRLLNLPPTDPFLYNLPFFYRDPDMNYSKIFYYGNEWYIVMQEMLTFLFYNYLFGSPLVAILITFLFNRLFSWIRDLFGRRNISSKAMIDQRFLI